jgi:hypothetical protein
LTDVDKIQYSCSQWVSVSSVKIGAVEIIQYLRH